jgi:phosphoserine phosphatase
MHPTAVLVTLTGRDRPGVIASVFAALAAHDVDVRDVEQVVVRDRLVLSLLFDLRGDPSALRGSLTKAASALGMDSEVVVADPAEPHSPEPSARMHVEMLGKLMRPGALGHVAQQIADLGANVESISRVADRPIPVLELLVRSPSPARLRGTLVRAAKEIGVDIAVQPAMLRWRPKRVVLLDATTALLLHEMADPLDALAERAGTRQRRAEIAEREARGNIDGAEALRAKAGLLAGLRTHDLHAVQDATPVRKEARDLVDALHALGYRVGAVAGDVWLGAERLSTALGLDFVACNQLEVRDDVLTGKLLGPPVDRAAKAAALVRFAERSHVPLSQTVAVGGAPNDIDLLQTAGLAIASVGGPSSLDSVLFALGVGDDVREAARARR